MQAGKSWRSLGGYALVVGALAFAVFWVMSATSFDDVPWAASLAIHGASIACLLFGLAALAPELRSPGATNRMVLVGVAITAVGLLTVFALIPLGLVLVGIGRLTARADTIPAALLVAGSVGLLTAVIAGVRVGMEDAPSLGLGSMLWFQGSAILIAAGLIGMGLRVAHRTAVERPS